MKTKLVLLIAILFVLPLSAASAQEQNPASSSQRYLVLSTVRLKTLQKELDQTVTAGYRVIFGDASHSILVLEKTPDKFDYRVVKNNSKEFQAALADSFHIVPGTFSLEKGGTMILEKPAGAIDTHDYKVLDTVRTGTLQKELNEWSDKGYELVALDFYGAKFALLEKPPLHAPPIPDRYLLLATKRTSTMQKEIDSAVARGYRVASGSGGDEVVVIMEKSESIAPAYLLLATARSSTLEKEINDAAAKGYRPLPRTLSGITKQNQLLPFGSNETVIIMEKTQQTPSFTYKIIGTTRVGTFEKELTQAAGQNFELIGMTLTYSEQIALLQRPAVQSPAGEKTGHR